MLEPDTQMRVLTLHDPWAMAMAFGLKLIETRDYPTSWRGWLAIHSAKSGIPDYAKPLFAMPNFARLFKGVTYHFGHVVAVCRIRACHTTESVVNGLTPREKMLGDYGPGRYAWLTGSLHRLEKPIPYSNGQRLRHAKPELIKAIREQLHEHAPPVV